PMRRRDDMAVRDHPAAWIDEPAGSVLAEGWGRDLLLVVGRARHGDLGRDLGDDERNGRLRSKQDLLNRGGRLGETGNREEHHAREPSTHPQNSIPRQMQIRRLQGPAPGAWVLRLQKYRLTSSGPSPRRPSPWRRPCFRPCTQPRPPEPASPHRYPTKTWHRPASAGPGCPDPPAEPGCLGQRAEPECLGHRAVPECLDPRARPGCPGQRAEPECLDPPAEPGCPDQRAEPECLDPPAGPGCPGRRAAPECPDASRLAIGAPGCPDRAGPGCPDRYAA